jgi:hypothetical protein
MQKIFILLVISILYYISFSTRRFVLSFLGSIVFAVLEALLYKIKKNVYFTTKEQFVMNMIFVPFIIEDFNRLFRNFYWRHFIFPFNIWIFELMMGFTLILIFGNNPAWRYKGRYSYFRNQINLIHYPRWLFLGVLQEILYFGIFVPLFDF